MSSFILLQGIIGVIGGLLLYGLFYFEVIAYVRKHHLLLISDFTELCLFIIVLGGSGYVFFMGIYNILRAIPR
jgi:hypothetical protein